MGEEYDREKYFQLLSASMTSISSNHYSLATKSNTPTISRGNSQITRQSLSQKKSFARGNVNSKPSESGLSGNINVITSSKGREREATERNGKVPIKETNNVGESLETNEVNNEQIKRTKTLIFEEENSSKNISSRASINDTQRSLLIRNEKSRLSITKPGRMSRFGSKHNSGLTSGLKRGRSSIVQEIKSKQERFKVVKELLSSETTYVNNLKTLVENYIEPCYVQQILPKRVCDIVFAGIKTIYFTNKKFHNELNEIYGQIKNPDEGNEDDRFEKMLCCFLKFVDVFKLYSSFVNNYDNARINCEASIKENKVFHDMCDNGVVKPMSSNGILSLLIIPVQRIPRYVMLVKDICKWTPRSLWSNRLALLKEKVDGLGKLINDSKKKQKQMDLLREYNSTITNFNKIIGEELVCAARYFVSEYDVFVYYKNRIKACTLVIFTDVVVLCKKDKKSFEVAYGSKLQKCRVFLSYDEMEGITALKTALLKKKGEKIRPFLDVCFGLEIIGRSITDAMIKPRIFLIWQNSSFPSSAAKIDLIQTISAWQQVLRNNSSAKRRESLAF